MTILELVSSVGSENINVQFLPECMTNAQYRAKQKLTEIKFLTSTSINDLIADGGDGKMGIILWVPRNKLPKPS